MHYLGTDSQTTKQPYRTQIAARISDYAKFENSKRLRSDRNFTIALEQVQQIDGVPAAVTCEIAHEIRVLHGELRSRSR